MPVSGRQSPKTVKRSFTGGAAALSCAQAAHPMSSRARSPRPADGLKARLHLPIYPSTQTIGDAKMLTALVILVV
jgi:hypothetical protein